MIGLWQKLEQLENESNPIMVSIVGARQMGRGLVSQISSMKGMRPAIVAAPTLENAKAAFTLAGYIENKHFAVAEDIDGAQRLIDSGKFAATSNISLAMDSPWIQCIVDATGNPEAGAAIAGDAIANKKHIVMLNVEADACFGHILHQKAQKAGVVYTGSAGDEPGAIMELYSLARALGYEIKALGKGKNNPVDYDCTPYSVEREANARGINPSKLCSFKDGTNTAVELTSLANATGFLPDIPGCHGITSTLSELPDKLSLKSEGRGGILARYGIVEYVNGLAPGVFAVISTDKPQCAHQLSYLYMGKGPNFCLFRPFHLCSMETPISIALACIYNQPTIAPLFGSVSDACAVAKTDLKSGTHLDGIGGFTIRGAILSSADAKAQNALPIGLINQNTRLIRDAKKGQLLTYDDLVLDESSPAVILRREQDAVRE